GRQDAQHHLSLGDEQPLPPRQVALLHIAKGGDARVIRMKNRNERHAEPCSAGLSEKIWRFLPFTGCMNRNGAAIRRPPPRGCSAVAQWNSCHTLCCRS